METSFHVNNIMSYEVVPRYFLEKVIDFGGSALILKKRLLTVQVAAGRKEGRREGRKEGRKEDRKKLWYNYAG